MDRGDVSLFSSINTGLSGLTAATAQFSATASNLANVETEGYHAKSVRLTDVAELGGVEVTGVDESPDEGVNPAKEMVGLVRAKALYNANAAVVSIADQMMGTLLDVMDDGDSRKDWDGRV